MKTNSVLFSDKNHHSYKYEYPSPQKLDGSSGIYFVVPASIILNSNGSDKRLTTFSYFSIRRGLDYNLTFSINSLVEWTGRKSNRRSNKINDKFIDAIKGLESQKYISLSNEIKNTNCIEASVNYSKINQECKTERFATIYLDELQKILNYSKLNPRDSYMNNDILLLVFAYLRMVIPRRRNRLFPEEVNVDNKQDLNYDIELRKTKSPDAYDCYYCDIAEVLGLSDRTISKAIAVLNEIGLIYSESLPRSENDGKWKTNHTIFCNQYKREGSSLLDNGEDYYLSEINNKKKKLERFIKM